MLVHVLSKSCQNVLKKSSKGRVNGLISKQGFFWPCLNQPNNFPTHLFHIYRLCEVVFFFEFFMIIWISVKPKFDQHLNKFETWKWKSKPGSFLVTPKWSFGVFLGNFMLQIQNHISSHMRVQSLRFEISHHIQAYFVWMYLDLVYQLELLVYDKLRTCALVFHFFYVFWIFYDYFEFGQT